MSEPTPCGAWSSPITAASLVAGVATPAEVVVDGDAMWWSESRPSEGGRTVVVCDGVDVTPADGNVRTMVHEYGGGAWWVVDGDLVHSEFADQRLHRRTPDGDDVALTPSPTDGGSWRFADGRPTPDGVWYVCVAERHDPGSDEPANELVAVALDGSLEVRTLVSGPDFVASPRVSPDGRRLAWIQWDHPNMPWDDTELWIAELGDGRLIGAAKAAGDGESFFQPEWDDRGRLHVVTDRDGWWHLHRLEGDQLVQRTAGPFEIATPQWVFGSSRYAFVDDDVWFVRHEGGIDRLAVLHPDGSTTERPLEATAISAVRRVGAGVAAVTAAYTEEPRVVTLGDAVAVRSSPRSLAHLEPWLPKPRAVEFPTGDGEVAHALVYPATNPDHRPLDGERPPLLVLAHGGPTGAARTQIQLSIAYWTSRGVAVADVNYRGSTGYGRAYRHRLHGEWGVADVEDCVAVAQHLVGHGEVDGRRLAIKGGSAGGFTVLAALTFHDVFTVGASRYGVADLAALATDTHKFEARYLDRLVGPWPEAADVYRERSPIEHVDRLDTPMLLLQGSLDRVVPPNQAHLMADALRARSVPFALIEFDDEGHGFRKADNQVRALEAELAFFADRFGFTPDDAVPALNIER